MRRAVSIFLIALLFLLTIGLILVYSASSTVDPAKPNAFVIRQGLALALSIVVAFIVSRFDYRNLKSLWLLLPIAIGGFIGTLLPFLYPARNGSHRWINLGFYQIQPSEFAKIAIILVFAAWFNRVGPRSSSFVRGFIIPGLLLALLLTPIILAPDIGTTIVIVTIVGTIFLAAGAKFRYLLLGITAIAILLGAIILRDPHRRGRVEDFMHGISSSEGAKAHQTVQSINAFVIGGPRGVGLNNSIQKCRYLPEAHTDFIYAIAGEELGLAASAGIILLFGLLLLSGTWIAFRSQDRFGRLLGLGLTVLLTFEAGFNMGMVMGCLPTKGLTLPFLSYGGSSLLASLIAVGILLNIARQNGLLEDQPPPAMRDALRRL